MDFRDLREQLSDETIIGILSQYNVEPQMETEDAIVFPTCCHNIEGGSHKLYYYKSTKLFHCFTQCERSFDIFDLLQRMHNLRGEEITLGQAVRLCNLDARDIGTFNINTSSDNELRYMQVLNESAAPRQEVELRKFDSSVLKNFQLNLNKLQPWIDEGIGVEVMRKFKIGYDFMSDAIIIPNFNYNGDLIGIRGRFLNKDDITKYGKYRPIKYAGTWYNYPTGKTFYGIYENHEAIERKHTCIIFEGEKSCLLYGTIYGVDNNMALATQGQNITKEHITLLLKMGVRNVVLAYDTDYESYDQLYAVEERYKEKARILEPYFNVSYLMDYDFDLPYKSSPIDGGQEIFEKILANRGYMNEGY